MLRSFAALRMTTWGNFFTGSDGHRWATRFKYKPDETWLPVDVFLEKPCAPDKLLMEIKKAID